MHAKRAILILTAFGLLIPFSVAQVDVTSAIGTTTDIDITDSDPDLAALAGHARYQVSWFGAGVLYTRDVPTSQQICAVPDGQATPVGETLNATATYIAFSDPNTHSWNSTKYTYGAFETYCVAVQSAHTDGDIGQYNFVLMVDTADLGTTELDLYVV